MGEKSNELGGQRVERSLTRHGFEGGKVSQTFADMTLGVVRVVGSAVAGFFTGLGGAGAGMQAALAPTPVAPAASDPPALIERVPEGVDAPAEDPARAPFQ